MINRVASQQTKKKIAKGHKSLRFFIGHDNVLANRGVIEGVWVFTRHGDRTPSRPLCAPHVLETEATFWRGKLPTPDPVTAFRMLSEYFPPRIHSSNGGKFLDVTRRPFGFLTKLGVEQMQTNGRRFFARYDHYGHHCDQTSKKSVGNGFLNSWDVQVFSTNYLRTVLSVQCFLDGLLGTECYSAKESDASIDEKFEIPNHSTVVVENEDGRVPVQVRDRSADTLNAFDRNHDLMMHLVSQVVSDPNFQERDATAAPLAARLANFLPGLARKGRRVFGGPSGINWIDASDHFVCRSAHGVKFSRFSAFEHDDRVEQTMSAMAHQTIAHLAWRFRQWYESPPLLAEIAAPPLREIFTQMRTIPGLKEQDRHPFVIYSCHDVTILALLYGIGADFLADESKGEWRIWPSYATTLVFELVRIDDEDESDSYMVRVLLNGKPIISANLLDYDGSEDLEYVGTGPMRMLRIPDFEDIVSRLEAVGGRMGDR